MTTSKIEVLKQALSTSEHTVVLCGSGMIEEAGVLSLKTPDRAYEIEEEYGDSPEYIFSDGYYSTRTGQFYDFYKKEILIDMPPTKSAEYLATLENQGKIHCIITSNLYDMPRRAGCKNVINMHGSIYENRCPHCGASYSMEYMKNSKKVPLCEKCKCVVRPQISLFGEMLDAQMIAEIARQLEKADVLILLGTGIDSEVFKNYIKYYKGNKLAVIHTQEELKDKRADLVIYDEPVNVLAQLIN